MLSYPSFLLKIKTKLNHNPKNEVEASLFRSKKGSRHLNDE
jgi:hypothetical protein